MVFSQELETEDQTPLASDLNSGTRAAALLGAGHCRVSAWSDEPGVSIL